MHVAIDATPLILSSGGLARYTAELSRGLAQVFPNDQFTLVSDQPFRFETVAGLNTMGGPVRGLSKRWWLFGVQKAIRKCAAGVFHGTNFAVPYLRLVPSVMTIHDLSPWMEEGWHHDARRVRRRTPFLLRTGRSDMLITVSQTVRNQAIERFRLDPARVVAVPLAAGGEFRPIPSKRSYFLFVGTIEPRKNTPMLIEAWRPVYQETGVELWLAGRKRADAPAVPEYAGLRWLGEVPDAALPHLYSGALAFVYPSLYEGFGLPVLEAMQCGACVITSTDAAISEVCGDAAIRLDPRDGRGWTQALVSCAQGGDRFDGLRLCGIARAKQFSWERTARLTYEVYEEAVRRHAH